jgi:tetratricopeptide (TPR) repeat protein
MIVGACALCVPVRPADALEGEARVELPRFVQAWSETAVPLPERVENTRTAALELGLRNVEPAARTLLARSVVDLPEGISRRELAEMAVSLAPDLPAAHMALARALWADFAIIGGFRSAVDAVLAFERNLAASLWLWATGFYAVAMTLALGAVAYLVLATFSVARSAAHDLGDRLSAHTPVVARVALLGSVILVPAALGEGVLGLCLGCLVVLGAYGSRSACLVAGVAAAALSVSLHLVLDQSSRGLVAYGSDPVVVSAYAAENGFATPVHLARLERAAETDALAARAMALGVKRTGDLAAADARYAELLSVLPDDPALLNNAANVRLALGDSGGAVELYKRALVRAPLAVVWFNLSQAWGVALNVVELDSALQNAQRLDPELVEDLSRIQERAIHFVADLTVDSASLRSRLLSSAQGGAAAPDLRRPLAPGVLGTRLPLTAGALFGALAVGVILGSRFRASRGCSRCAALVCPRCDGDSAGSGLCESCSRLTLRTEGTDSAMRAEHARKLGRREAQLRLVERGLAVAVPGAGGLLLDRHGLALTGCVAAAGALIFFSVRGGIAADPLAAGAAGPVLLSVAAGLCFLVYALLTLRGVRALGAR